LKLFIFTCKILCLVNQFYTRYIVNSRGLSGQPLCRFTSFTFFLSHLHVIFGSCVYLLNVPYQPLAYSSLSLSLCVCLTHSNIFSVSTLSNAALKSTNSAYIFPLSSLIHSLLNDPGCTLVSKMDYSLEFELLGN
jgi:uncharacterized membrane protein YcgQ (UPF0703/DUF1980 family)